MLGVLRCCFDVGVLGWFSGSGVLVFRLRGLVRAGFLCWLDLDVLYWCFGQFWEVGLVLILRCFV